MFMVCRYAAVQQAISLLLCSEGPPLFSLASRAWATSTSPPTILALSGITGQPSMALPSPLPSHTPRTQKTKLNVCTALKPKEKPVLPREAMASKVPGPIVTQLGPPSSCRPSSGLILLHCPSKPPLQQLAAAASLSSFSITVRQEAVGNCQCVATVSLEGKPLVDCLGSKGKVQKHAASLALEMLAEVRPVITVEEGRQDQRTALNRC